MARELTRFLEMYEGSSFPTRSETSDGQICVVKLRGAGNGSGALLSEFIVNRLAHAAGLPVPDAFVVNLASGFPWNFGTDEFCDLVKNSPGPNLGLEWIDRARPVRAEDYNTLPHDFVSQVVTLDLVSDNRDRPMGSGNLLEDRRRRHWIVDHGSCRFLFQPLPAERRSLPRGHAFAGWEDAFDPRWLQSIGVAEIADTMAKIPDLWLAETKLVREDVARTVTDCLRWSHEWGRWTHSASQRT